MKEIEEIANVVESVVGTFRYENWSEQTRDLIQIKLESAAREAGMEFSEITMDFNETTHELNIKYKMGDRTFITTVTPEPATSNTIDNA